MTPSSSPIVIILKGFWVKSNFRVQGLEFWGSKALFVDLVMISDGGFCL